MPARVLVAYASGTGCDSACAVDIAKEIADVPELEVDIAPMSSVRSIRPYVATYVGWVHPSAAGRRELERFLNTNAALLPDRPVWIVHHHAGCSSSARNGAMRLTRLVFTPPVRDLPPTANVPPARRKLAASAVG